MLGDVFAEGAAFFGSILNNLRIVVIRLKVNIPSCGVKHGNYLATVVVILVMLLGLGCRQGKQTKNSYSGAVIRWVVVTLETPASVDLS